MRRHDGTEGRALAAVAALAITVTAGCGGRRMAPRAYVEMIQAERAAKDRFLGTATDSPIPADRRATLLPLPYYPPDESWSVPASLQPVDPALQSAIEMPTSTGDRRQMRRVGVLAFTLQGQALRLSAFVEAEARNTDRLFVPFTDETSGVETYKPGRYIDLDRTATGIYVIDFNRAYNPYCAYNPEYDCPYPPRENHLGIAVRAGERLPAGAGH